MTDPAILFVKPKAISRDDKAALQKAGVIVVEIADPHAVNFVRPHAELSSGTLLHCAAEAIDKHISGRDIRADFGRLAAQAILTAKAHGVKVHPRVAKIKQEGKVN
jgi:hypothetical protein